MANRAAGTTPNGHTTPGGQTTPNGHITPSGRIVIQEQGGPRMWAWWRDNEGSMQWAQALVRTYGGQGYRFYRTRAVGQPYDEIKEFDPEAYEIVGILPLCGGAW